MDTRTLQSTAHSNNNTPAIALQLRTWSPMFCSCCCRIRLASADRRSCAPFHHLEHVRLAQTFRQLIRSTKAAVENYVHSIRTVVHPPSSRMLAVFKDPDVLSRFQVTTDKVLQGNSTATLERRTIGQLSYGVFQGVIDPPDYGDRPNRGGFASFRTLVRAATYVLACYALFPVLHVPFFAVYVVGYSVMYYSQVSQFGILMCLRA